MALNAGTRLGPYEIVNAIGAGGMGEVYKARDTRLDRTVAIKVLPDALAGDPERRERFEREARAVSSLNHPHICALYDIGEADVSIAQGPTPSAQRPSPGAQTVQFLVMELLEGESLAELLKKGPLPLDQVLRYGIEIADALGKAHSQGIVHRDLKPGNVMITKQGAKLLDFGLARVGAPVSPSSVSFLPTQQQPLTQQGTLLGTFQYMSPEQVEGREADARSDIFAFGALLYEMLTGRKAFEGKSQASLIGAIMTGSPPPISSLQPMTPPALERAVRMCLAKDPDDRWQTARDLGAELKWIGEGGSQLGIPAPVVARRKSRERWAWAAAAAFAIVTAVLAGRFATTSETVRPPTRFAIASPKGVTPSWPRVSPDGRTVAFVGTDLQGKRSIWIRPLGSFDAVHLDGTEGVNRPFWSPDSRYLAYFSGDQLKKVPVSGGPPQLICESQFGSDGSWSPQGVILFDGRVADPIRRVSDSGGVPTIAVAPDAGRKEVGAAWPFFLPDGRHFLFLGNDTKGPKTLRLGTLDSTDSVVLGDSPTRVEYAAGHVFYVNQQTLLARPFSAAKLAFTGEPFPVTDRVQATGAGLVDFSTSVAGDIVYIPDAQEQQSRLVWLDRTGKEVGTVGQPGLYRDLALAPDETRVATTVYNANSVPQIWVTDIKRGASSRLTFGDDARYPIWSPDNARVVYATVKGTEFVVAQKLASGAGDEQLLTGEKDSSLFPTDWSPDGKALLLQWLNAAGDNADLVTVPPDGHGGLGAFLRAPKPIWEIGGRFSPDGHWVAYQSNESGRYEVYVQAFPPAGGKWQISTAGGSVPMWRGDGKEIFYQGNGDDIFYAVSVQAGGASLEIGLPVKLFQHRTLQAGRARNRWVVTRDGQRFLLNEPVDEGASRGIQVVLDWTAGLKK